MSSDVLSAATSIVKNDTTAVLTEQIPRNSHTEFFNARNWDTVRSYWSNLIGRSIPIPSVIAGDEVYGFTDIDAVHSAGQREYSMKDPRYSRKHTFALRLGYVGEEYDVCAHFIPVFYSLNRAISSSAGLKGFTLWRMT